jgi:hypothetical protein
MQNVFINNVIFGGKYIVTTCNQFWKWFPTNVMHTQLLLYKGLGWCYLTQLSTIFQLYHGQFYWWGKLQYLRKPPTCCKSLTKFITYWVHLAMSEIRTHIFSGDCIGICKSNYHMIMTTTVIGHLVTHYVVYW